MLGGSSSMNAMMWVRGFAADYDEWGELAGEQWSFAKLAPYFARIEAGPLVISPQRSPRASTAAWLAAVQECGYRVRAAEYRCAARLLPNHGDATPRRAVELRGRVPETRTAATEPDLAHRGARSAGAVRRRPARSVSSSTRTAGAHVVQRPSRGGAVLRCGQQPAAADGLGNRRRGRASAAHGIDVVHASPDVGKNLIDHLVTPLGFEVRHDSLFAAEKPWELVKYLLRRRGMLTSNVGEAYGFVRSRPDLELPDLELIFAPAPFFDEGLGDPYGHAVVCGPILVKPYSRGTISLSSPDPIGQTGHRSEVSVRPGRRGPRSDDVGSADHRENRRSACAQGRAGQDRATTRRARHPRGNARQGAADVLAHAVSPGRAPAGWEATRPAWSTRSCGCAASTGCGWPTRR